MVEKEYAMAYVQVLEVLKGLSRTEYNRIPKERIELYEENKDKSYVFHIEEGRDINEQISDRARIILANLFVRYIAYKKDKEEIYNKEKQEFIKAEIKKRENLNIKPLFENKEVKHISEEKSLTKIEEKGIFKKLMKKIINFFKFGKNYGN